MNQRADMSSLAKLIESADGGGYSLPAELLAAYTTYLRVSEVALPPVDHLDEQTAATKIIEAVAAGEDPDVAGLAADLADDLEKASRAERARGLGQQAIQLAVDQAGYEATRIAADLTEVIISEHLRPVLEQIHEEARSVAAALDGYGLNPQVLITAPTKARNAYAQLGGLVSRYQAIFAARSTANFLGRRQPEHDELGMFTEFADPMAFHPNWRLPTPMPTSTPAPKDPSARLLWVVGAEAAIGKPWLPTVAEQDAAWWKTFGSAVERDRQNRQQLDGWRKAFA